MGKRYLSTFRRLLVCINNSIGYGFKSMGPLGRPPRFRGALSGRSGGEVGPWVVELRRGSANMG
jgi:hypothetical protein